MVTQPDEPDNALDPVGRRMTRAGIDRSLAILIGLGTFCLLLGTSRDFGMVWDEGWAIEAGETLSKWFAWLWNDEGLRPRSEAFSKSSLERFWPFSKEIPNTHPPGHVLMILAGWWPSHRMLNALDSSRLGPMIVNSLGAAAIFFHLARRRSRLAGITGSLAFVLMPRNFALAHYAHCDMPLSVLWVLAQMAFLRSLESARWSLLFGSFLGLAILTKFTGVFAIVPPLLWVALFEWMPCLSLTPYRRSSRRTRGFRGTGSLVVGGFVAALVLYALQPPWWSNPVEGVRRFVAASLSRERVIPLPTYYLGQTYDFSLPWHNTIVLTVAATPMLVLVLGVFGAGFSVARARQEPWPILWVLSWMTLLIVRALPNAPGHDGIRLFLPSFASLAVLTGLGVDAIRTRLRNRMMFVAPLLSLAMAAESVVGIAQVYPYTDSYFSASVGGLPGAEKLGLDVTYFWEVLGPEFQSWVRERARRGPVEVRFQGQPVVVDFARKWGQWPQHARIAGADPTASPMYVMMRRKSIYNPTDWELDRDPSAEFSITRQGVDLLRIYPFEASYRAFMKSSNRSSPNASDR